MTDPESDEGDATTILVAGTASHVGKSVLTAGMCRSLSDRGFSVAPFKAQNMSNNARVVVSPEQDGTSADADTGTPWGEIGVSQYVQARAADVTPTTDMNPVLLKPRGNNESQLVVHGQAVTHLKSDTYYDEYWERAREAANASHRRLRAKYDVILAEGAGSIAEINLQDHDLANLETARFADSEILLVGDIERGGVFASLYGTLELMPADVRERVTGIVINKFSGSESILEPGLDALERMTDVPVLGVLPVEDPGLPAEDSVTLPQNGEHAVFGTEDDVADSKTVRVAVPRLPHISNFTDLEPLYGSPGVSVHYVPLENDLAGYDGVVLPGTKNTVDDRLALKGTGFDSRLRSFDGPILGICGGYQMLGQHLEEVGVESTAVEGTIDGLGLLPVATSFSSEKELTRTTCNVQGIGPLDGATGTVSAYEIHTGETRFLESVIHPLEPSSALVGDVLGTYLHGLFENENVREAFVDGLFERAGMDRQYDGTVGRTPYERAKHLVEANIDLSNLFSHE